MTDKTKANYVLFTLQVLGVVTFVNCFFECMTL